MHGVAAACRLAKIKKSSFNKSVVHVNLQRFVLVRSDCQRQECEIVPVCKLHGKGYSFDRYRFDKIGAFPPVLAPKVTLSNCHSAVRPRSGGMGNQGVAAPRLRGVFQKRNATAMLVEGSEADTNTFCQPFGTTRPRPQPTRPRIPTPARHALTNTRPKSGTSHDFRPVDSR
jgi:hypothetical protein